MNLEIADDNYIYFTSDISCLGDLSSVDEDVLGLFLKNVFLNLSDVYSIDLFGYYKVDIYVDEKIGAFVEISKIDDYISYNRKIDTKVTLSVDNFYLKTNDLSNIYKCKPIYCSDNDFYVSTKDVDNLFDLIEFCEVVYKDINLSSDDIVFS